MAETASTRKRRHPPRPTRPRPNLKDTLSEDRLKQRAQLRLDRSMQSLRQRVPPHTLPNIFDHLPAVELSSLSKTTQALLLRLAQKDAEASMKQERFRIVSACNAERRRLVAEEQAEKIYKAKAEAVEEARRQQEELEKARKESLRLDRLRWKRRGEELQKQLCGFAEAKELREREQTHATEEASRVEAHRRQAAKKHAKCQKAKVREWCQQRAEQELQEVEEQRALLARAQQEEERRRRVVEEEEVLSMVTRAARRQRIAAW